jgi:hypothetical protein
MSRRAQNSGLSKKVIELLRNAPAFVRYIFGIKIRGLLVRGLLRSSIAFRIVFERPQQFTFNKRQYRYFYHSRNKTWQNERAIEVPIICREIKKHEAQRILEVGNVLSHYYPVYHDIVDKWEEAPGVTNADIRNFDTSKDYDLIVSISTIEHVAYDELVGIATIEHISYDYDELTLKAQAIEESESFEEPVRDVIENLKSHLSQGGEIFITVPLGFNPALDRLLKEKKIFTDITYLKRISENNIWREVYDTEIHDVRYNWQSWHANVLAVCVFQRIPNSLA